MKSRNRSRKERKMFSRVLMIAFCMAVLWYAPVAAQTWKGQVVSVVDGDIVKVYHPERDVVKVMLYGLDAPDKRQPYFSEAKEFLTEKVLSQTVNIIEMESEQKVPAVLIYLGGLNINEEVVRSGWGWVYEKYCEADFCQEWQVLEREARRGKLGLWQSENPEPPWQWRKSILKKIFRVVLWILSPWSD